MCEGAQVIHAQLSCAEQRGGGYMTSQTDPVGASGPTRVTTEPEVADAATSIDADGTIDDSAAKNDEPNADMPAATGAAPTSGIEADVSGRELSRQILSVETRLLHAFEEKLAFDAVKEKQLDRLHEELQRHRSDLVAKAIRPVFQSVIRLHDDLGKVLEALAREDPALLTADRLLKLLSGFRDDVELALNNNGVSSFRSETEMFDPRKQRVLRTVDTTDESQVGRLAARLRPGFEYEDNILEKERVAVFALAPSKATSKS